MSKADRQLRVCRECDRQIGRERLNNARYCSEKCRRHAEYERHKARLARARWD